MLWIFCFPGSLGMNITIESTHRASDFSFNNATFVILLCTFHISSEILFSVELLSSVNKAWKCPKCLTNGDVVVRVLNSSIGIVFFVFDFDFMFFPFKLFKYCFMLDDTLNLSSLAVPSKIFLEESGKTVLSY